MARADTTLTTDQLRGFAQAVAAWKRSEFGVWSPPMRSKGENLDEAYEDFREVAVVAMEAHLNGRQIFDPDKILEWADQGGIPRTLAIDNMPVLQGAIARGTAEYCIAIAAGVRPEPRSRSRLKAWLFGPSDDGADSEFHRLIDALRSHGPIVNPAVVEPAAAVSTAPQICLAHPIPPEEGPVRQEPDELGCQAGSVPGHPCLADQISEPDQSYNGHPELFRALSVGASQVSSEPLESREMVAPIEASQGSIMEPPVEQPAAISEWAVAVALQRSGEAPPTTSATCPSSQGAETPANPPHADVWDGRLSTIWSEFVDDQIAIAGWSPSRRPELAGTLRIFQRLIGDVSILNLMRDDASRLRRRFCALPTDHKNMWLDREKDVERTFDELIAFVGQEESRRKIKFERVSAKSWNKHCGTLSACVGWLKANKQAAAGIEDAFRGLFLTVPKTKTAIRLEREMTTTVSLQALLLSEVWSGRRSVYHLIGRGEIVVRDSLYWVPLMEVCMGLRREEACQLRGRHVSPKFGILGIDLFSKDLRVKEKDGASRRFVPLPQALIDVGFVDCLIAGRDPDEMLFPELSSDNAHRAYGVAYGKRFLNYVANVKPDFSSFAAESCDAMNIPPAERDAMIEREIHRLLTEFREKTSNHAIRHWFKTQAENAGCKTSFVEELMGHAHPEQKTEGGRYMKEVFVQNLKKTIDMVPMPFDPRALRQIAERSPPPKKTR